MITLPDPSSTFAVADWMELFLASTGEPISKARMSHVIEGASGQEPAESFITDVWHELECRQQLYTPSPFLVGDRVVARNEDVPVKPEYLACLILSLFGVRSPQSNISKLFERLTSHAVKGYLSGEAIVFGWPPGEDGEPSIKQRVLDAANRLGEKFAEAPAERYNDRGVDVIAWKPFSERRSSQVVLLLQCASGRNWRGKTMELPLAAWEQYIHWACNPVKGFAVPCVICERDWHDVSTEAGVLFDRARIVNLLRDTLDDPQLNDDVAGWVRTQLAALDE